MEAEKRDSGMAGVVKLEGKNLLQYWESEATRPQIQGPGAEGRNALEQLAVLPSGSRVPDADNVTVGDLIKAVGRLIG